MPLAADTVQDRLKALNAITGTKRHASTHNTINNQQSNERISDPTYLKLSQMQGDFDAHKMLVATIGAPNKLGYTFTHHHLKAFVHNIEVAKSKFSGGITPEQVINLSRSEDIARANKQIHACTPYSRKGNVVRFVTNASSTSKVSRHYITVEFNNFNILLADDKTTHAMIKKGLQKGGIKFECDCGRHQFWYRYIATVGKYGCGRPEYVYPRIRNHNLTGVACKHVLRVMRYILSGIGYQYLFSQLKKERVLYQQGIHGKTKAVSQSKIDTTAKKQTASSGYKIKKKDETFAKRHTQNLSNEIDAMKTKALHKQVLRNAVELHRRGLIDDETLVQVKRATR